MLFLLWLLQYLLQTRWVGRDQHCLHNASQHADCQRFASTDMILAAKEMVFEPRGLSLRGPRMKMVPLVRAVCLVRRS